jgi:hypothetical protein
LLVEVAVEQALEVVVVPVDIELQLDFPLVLALL